MNCLKTTLDGIDTNDRLIGMSEILVDVPAVETDRQSSIIKTYNDSGTVTLIGEGELVQGGTSAKTLNYSYTPFTIPNNACKLRLTTKYAITMIRNLPNLNLHSIKYSNRLFSLNETGSSCHGDISDLPSSLINVDITSSGVYGNIDVNTPLLSDNLTNLVLYNTSVSGDVSAFGKCGILTELIIRNTSINGTIEDFVDAAYTKRQAQGSVTVNFNGTEIKITDDISAVSGFANNNCKIWWSDSNTYYYQNGTDSDIEDTSKHITIYAKNINQQQINYWESYGNVVIPIT